MAHPERRSPCRRRRAPDIQNPVGEAIGPWDDSSGSAAEDEEYERDSFVVSDDDEAEPDEEDLSDNSEMPSDQDNSDSDNVRDSDGSNSLSVDMARSARQTYKRRRTNMIVSDEEEDEGANTPAKKLGRKYRVQRDSSEELST